MIINNISNPKIISASGFPNVRSYGRVFLIIFTVFLSGNGLLGGPREAEAAAAWQASGSKDSGNGSLTVVWPTHQADDVGLLFVESENDVISLTTANGFAEVTNSPIGTGTAGAASATRLAVYWCRATSSAMASPVVADSGDHTFGVIVTYRGVVTTGDPWDITANDVTTPANTNTNFPDVTTTSKNDLIVLAAANDKDAASSAEFSAFANSNLIGVTERFDQVVSTGDGGGVGVADGAMATAAAVGVSTGTHNSSITTQMTIALISEISPYQGGNADGFDELELQHVVTQMFYGGNDDGFSFQTQVQAGSRRRIIVVGN